MLAQSLPHNVRCLPEPLGLLNMARRKHRHVYIVDSSDDVPLEARFMRSNPDYQSGKPYVYVGMTRLARDVWFDKHNADIETSLYMQEFGQRLSPEIYALHNRLTNDEARSLSAPNGY